MMMKLHAFDNGIESAVILEDSHTPINVDAVTRELEAMFGGEWQHSSLGFDELVSEAIGRHVDVNRLYTYVG